MSTQALRDAFLVDVFEPGKANLLYCEMERVVVGGIVPTQAPLALEAGPELAAAFFCERREAGILNIGGTGTVTVDGTEYELASLDALYIGRGSREVAFASKDGDDPARFYLVSYPAHAAYPTTLARRAEANALELGSPENANQRTIYQYIHEGGIKSCQLVMGFTSLAPGSVWNTMPCHTHERRTEVYLYFALADEARVFHFMGTGDETRHLVMAEGQAALSPAWSIHCGCGTGAYSFCWAMGGENQRFDDMDGIAIGDLR
jgi:4-deoxy-L-threo-5-hexosulose-uronate ketol-isomerase